MKAYIEGKILFDGKRCCIVSLLNNDMYIDNGMYIGNDIYIDNIINCSEKLLMSTIKLSFKLMMAITSDKTT